MSPSTCARAHGAGFLGSWLPLGLSYSQTNRSREVLGRGCLWLPPACLEQARLSSASLWGSSSVHGHQQDLGGPNVGPGCAAWEGMGSSLPGDKTVDRGAAQGAGACDTPTAVQLCPCRLPLSPSPLGALQPGRWRGAPRLLCCCLGQPLLCQPEGAAALAACLGLAELLGTPGADAGRDPPCTSEELVQVKERASVCWRLCRCRNLRRNRTRNQQTHFQH